MSTGLIVVRPFDIADAGAVAGLLGQLDYPVEYEAQVVERYTRLAMDAAQAVYVAVLLDEIVGLLHFSRICLLASDGYVEVHALVVDEAVRGRGVGARLMQTAEAWSAKHGCDRVRLRSGMHREDAHRFYQSIGYTAKRASMAFEKVVALADETH